MADLDDFFAKKDKKKSKGKAKFLTNDELLKKLEDTSKREPITTTATATAETESIVDEQPQQKIILSSQQQEEKDEEWKEFEEETRKDYSGLKLGQLQINRDDDECSQEDEYEDGESDSNVNGENIPDGWNSNSTGPWKKVIPADKVMQIVAPSAENEKKVYISPALRQAQTGSSTGVRRNRAAPDITNSDFFPTLGAARPEEQRKKNKEPAFEEVRHGSRMQRIQPTAVAPPTTASNRFQTLDEDDS